MIEQGNRWCQFHGAHEMLTAADWAACDHCGHVWQSRAAWDRDMLRNRMGDTRDCPLCRTRSVLKVGEGIDMELQERQRRWHAEMIAAKEYVELAENSIKRAVEAIPPTTKANGPVVDTSEVDSLQAEAGVYAAMATMHYAAASAFGNFPE